MPNTKTTLLLDLIHSTSKSERRTFKLISQRTSGDKLYVKLFDILAKMEVYNEQKILKKIPNLKKTQLSNLKAILFKQVLRAIRDAHKDSYVTIKAREHFDFAKVLYSKGQYKASLDMIQKVKKLASSTYNEPLVYLAIHFEKQIEAQHVTGSMSPKAFKLSNDSSEIISSLSMTDKLSSFSLKLYAVYLQRGLVWDVKDRDYLHGFFKKELPVFKLEELNFYQKLYLFQSYVWFYHMLQDFPKYYRYANRWLSLFTEYPEMKRPETIQMIKGYHNVLNALFMAQKEDLFIQHLKEFESLNEDEYFDFSTNEGSQWKLFTYVHRINYIFMHGNYQNAPSQINDIITYLEHGDHRWDLNRTIVFQYKIACVYFGAADLQNTIYHLNKITNFYYKDFKQDIQCYARILNLIAHFDLGNDDLVSYQVKNVYRFLLGMKELSNVHMEIFRFIRKIPRIVPSELKNEFVSLKNKLLPLETDPLERRPFLYLDIISWLDTKIFGVSMMEAILNRKQST